MSSFLDIKKYSPGITPSPEILAQSDLPPPDRSKSWHILPYSTSTVRASERSSIMTSRKSYTGFPTSHQPRFCAAPNFLKMGIKYLNLSSFIQASTIKDERSAAKFHYIKTVSGSCSAINCLSSGINILAGGSSVPLISERKGSDPHRKQLHSLFLFGRWHDHLSAVVLCWSSVLC